MTYIYAMCKCTKFYYEKALPMTGTTLRACNVNIAYIYIRNICYYLKMGKCTIIPKVIDKPFIEYAVRLGKPSFFQHTYKLSGYAMKVGCYANILCRSIYASIILTVKTHRAKKLHERFCNVLQI